MFICIVCHKVKASETSKYTCLDCEKALFDWCRPKSSYQLFLEGNEDGSPIKKKTPPSTWHIKAKKPTHKSHNIKENMGFDCILCDKREIWVFESDKHQRVCWDCHYCIAKETEEMKDHRERNGYSLKEIKKQAKENIKRTLNQCKL